MCGREPTGRWSQEGQRGGRKSFHIPSEDYLPRDPVISIFTGSSWHPGQINFTRKQNLYGFKMLGITLVYVAAWGLVLYCFVLKLYLERSRGKFDSKVRLDGKVALVTGATQGKSDLGLVLDISITHRD